MAYYFIAFFSYHCSIVLNTALRSMADGDVNRSISSRGEGWAVYSALPLLVAINSRILGAPQVTSREAVLLRIGTTLVINFFVMLALRDDVNEDRAIVRFFFCRCLFRTQYIPFLLFFLFISFRHARVRVAQETSRSPVLDSRARLFGTHTAHTPCEARTRADLLFCTGQDVVWGFRFGCLHGRP
jgi:hypothetical protein